MFNMNSLSRARKTAWDILRSPRTISLLKLGAAVVGVIHAIDELRESPKIGRQPIGFRVVEADADEEQPQDDSVHGEFHE